MARYISTIVASDQGMDWGINDRLKRLASGRGELIEVAIAFYSGRMRRSPWVTFLQFIISTFPEGFKSLIYCR
jgi:hypothetical protein